MQRLAFTLLLTVLVSFTSASAVAETLVQDKIYTGPVTLEVPTYNIKMKVPKGWRGALPSGSEAFVMERADGSDGKLLVLITPSSEAELKQTLQGPLPLGDGIVAQPDGELKHKNGLFTRPYALPENPATTQLAGVEVSVVARMIDGKAVGAIALAPGASLKMFASTAQTMVKGARSYKPKPVKGAPKGAWADKLKDRNLYKFHSGSGYSEKTKLTLCSNGAFARNFNATSLSQLGSGVAASGNQGTWAVNGTTLTLNYADGSTATYTLTEREGSLYMNGDKWLRENTSCR